MVKRPKSPVVNEDARYLVVYQPYPLNANWELAGDYIAFAFWIASIVGVEPVLGIHYKPGGRSMVLLEIEKRFPDHALLLGEHRWSEILKNPTDEERERTSQVFYCLYKTLREAQKDGWKRIHVENHWFEQQGWSKESSRFKYVYPETHWCPQPAEDPTNKSICRPLPVAVKPPPPAAPTLVPGSAQWIAQQTGSTTTPQQNQGALASGSKNKPQGKAPVVRRPQVATQAAPAASALKQPIATTSLTSGTRPSKGTRNNAKSTPNASPVSPLPVPSALSGYPAAPPGITSRDRTVVSTSNKSGSANVAQVRQAFVAPNVAESPQTSLGIFDLEDDDDDENADADELEQQYVAAWERDAVSEPASGSLQVVASTGDMEEEEAVENLWGDDNKVTEVEELVCPFHGNSKLCKKGICEARKKLELEIAKQKRDASTAKDKGKRTQKGKGPSTTTTAAPGSKSPTQTGTDGLPPTPKKRGGRGKKVGDGRRNTSNPTIATARTKSITESDDDG